MRPRYLLQVFFVCKKSATRFIRFSMLSFAAMAPALQLDTVSPTCTTSASPYEGLEEDDVTPARSQTLPENTVKVRCWACVRNRMKPDSKPSRSCFLFKNHQNKAKFCIGAYLRFIWLDSLLLFVFGILILGLQFAPSNRHDLPLMPFWSQVPLVGNVTGQDLDLRAPIEFLYPYSETPLSDMACAVLVVLVPIIVIGLFQLRICSVWDFYAGQLGTLKAVTTTTLIVLILKLYVGAFRPNFFDVCQPNRSLLHEEVIRHMESRTALFFNATVCTGEMKLVKNALQSFPSGHAANSFAAAIFLTLYINAKLKTIGDHASPYWTFMVMITPLILASILAALMYITHQHHMRDIYAGMVLGLIIGIISYRSVYAAVFDPRYNHIPLPPFAAKTQFAYLKDKRKGQAVKPDEHEEIDNLIVWSWWKVRQNEKDRAKEEFWLQNIRTTRATGCEKEFTSGPTLPHNEGDIIPWERVEASSRSACGRSKPGSQYAITTLGTPCAIHSTTSGGIGTEPKLSNTAPGNLVRAEKSGVC